MAVGSMSRLGVKEQLLVASAEQTIPRKTKVPPTIFGWMASFKECSATEMKLCSQHHDMQSKQHAKVTTLALCWACEPKQQY